ncbi:MAG: tyrosine-type recombinase/integrase [Syntrophales bacterium]
MQKSEDKVSAAADAPVSFPGYCPGRPSKRIPAVLSQRECQALFSQLTGSTRLMAQLMYGAGLRLMELLRLRVQDVNFEQGIVIVRCGKGGNSGGVGRGYPLWMQK